MQFCDTDTSRLKEERAARTEELQRRCPSDLEVATIMDNYGVDAACERWSQFEPRTLHNMAQRGRKALKGSVA